VHNTVLTGADLNGANFSEADLKGAKFDGSLLYGAQFKCARNIPATLASKLDENGVYKDTEPFQPLQRLSENTQIRVFISKPGFLDYQQQQHVKSLLSRLETEGIISHTLERTEYPQFGVISEVQRLMSDCAGAVIFGFKQLEVSEGFWRSSTPEEKHLKDIYLATPWNHVEAGMEAMLGIPIFIVCQRGVDGGIFDVALGEHQIYRVFIEDDWNATTYLNSLAGWCADVRERSRSS